MNELNVDKISNNSLLGSYIHPTVEKIKLVEVLPWAQSKLLTKNIFERILDVVVKMLKPLLNSKYWGYTKLKASAGNFNVAQVIISFCDRIGNILKKKKKKEEMLVYPAFFSFSTMFLKSFAHRVVKTRDFEVKGSRLKTKWYTMSGLSCSYSSRTTVTKFSEDDSH